MIKKRPCTQTGFTKKRTLERKSCLKKHKHTKNQISAGTHLDIFLTGPSWSVTAKSGNRAISGFSCHVISTIHNTHFQNYMHFLSYDFYLIPEPCSSRAKENEVILSGSGMIFAGWHGSVEMTQQRFCTAEEKLYNCNLISHNCKKMYNCYFISQLQNST